MQLQLLRTASTFWRFRAQAQGSKVKQLLLLIRSKRAVSTT